MGGYFRACFKQLSHANERNLYTFFPAHSIQRIQWRQSEFKYRFKNHLWKRKKSCENIRLSAFRIFLVILNAKS